MRDDVIVQIELHDTDGNVYQSRAKNVILKAKGDILHKVKLKEKNTVKVKKDDFSDL